MPILNSINTIDSTNPTSFRAPVEIYVESHSARNEPTSPPSPMDVASPIASVDMGRTTPQSSPQDVIEVSTPQEPRSVAPAKIPKMENFWHLKATRSAWTTTYWPYSGRNSDTTGNPHYHLWAKNGCLNKLDQVLKLRGQTPGARAHELVPALNFLKGDGSPSGYYIPSTLLKEDDAETTTGVDFTGSGRLKDWVKVDFLDDHKRFGKNGKTDGALNVGWWGSCDQVALAGILFDEPKREIKLNGVTFTPQDIRGLLTVIANSQSARSQYCGWRFTDAPDKLTLKTGKVLVGRAINIGDRDCLKSDFVRRNGNKILVTKLASDEAVEFQTAHKLLTVQVADIATFEREDEEEPSASDFHKTVKKWLREDRPFAMDRDSGNHIWNKNVDEAVINKTRACPRDVKPKALVGFDGPYAGGDLCFYKTVLKRDDARVSTYMYWIEKNDGVHVNSGWRSNNPAFLWRPETAHATFEGTNARNPFVTPQIVQEAYLLSTIPRHNSSDSDSY